MLVAGPHSSGAIASQATSFRLEAETEKVVPGESVTLTATHSGGVAATVLELTYDWPFQLTAWESLGGLSVCNDTDFGMVRCSAVAVEQLPEELFTFTFDIAESADDGEHPIGLKVTECSDSVGDLIQCTASGTTVRVHTPTPTPKGRLRVVELEARETVILGGVFLAQLAVESSGPKLRSYVFEVSYPASLVEALACQSYYGECDVTGPSTLRLSGISGAGLTGRILVGEVTFKATGAGAAELSPSVVSATDVNSNEVLPIPTRPTIVHTLATPGIPPTFTPVSTPSRVPTSPTPTRTPVMEPTPSPVTGVINLNQPGPATIAANESSSDLPLLPLGFAVAGVVLIVGGLFLLRRRLRRT